MDEKLIKEIIEKVTEQSYIPGDWVGVSDARVVNLNDAIDILKSYKSPKGLQKISDLQDKYKFQNTFEIIEREDIIDFLRDLSQAQVLGLNIEEEDAEWMQNVLDVLTNNE